MKTQSPSPAVSRQWIREGSFCRENVGSMTLETQVLALGTQRNELLLTGRDLLSGQVCEQWLQLRVKGRLQPVWAEEMWRPPRSQLLSEEARSQVVVLEPRRSTWDKSKAGRREAPRRS